MNNKPFKIILLLIINNLYKINYNKFHYNN